MRVPRLNRALTLETPVRVPDGSGGYVAGWQALGTLWAEIAPGTGRETAARAVQVSRVPLRIVVRAAPVGSAMRPVADQRFREGTRRFAILSVTERDADGHYLVCQGEEETVA